MVQHRSHPLISKIYGGLSAARYLTHDSKPGDKTQEGAKWIVGKVHDLRRIKISIIYLPAIYSLVDLNDGFSLLSFSYADYPHGK